MAKSKSRHGHGTGIPNPVDVHVGARVRVRRPLLYQIRLINSACGFWATSGSWCVL